MSKIQDTVMTYLKQFKGVYAKKIILTGTTGTPDIILCFRGRFYGFEVKEKGDTQSPLQAYNERKIKEAGGEYHIITSFAGFVEIWSKIIEEAADAI